MLAATPHLELVLLDSDNLHNYQEGFHYNVGL